MAKNSVDDMYKGCSTEMEEKAEEYLKDELNKDPMFKKTWVEAEEWYDHTNEKGKADVNLSKEQKMALYAYTSDAVYADFNKATREQGPEYKTTFKYHALHFYLTTALQTLRAQKQCFIVYRRTNMFFEVSNVLKKEVRLGSFASTSLRIDLKQFGDKSCFEIETCMGVNVSKHSKYQTEAEVLIPPYEVFTVTKITKGSKLHPLQCDVVYKLKSTRKSLSNLNCVLIKKKRCKFPWCS
ncbi:uncharacterized protein ACO6RY_05589 [Pungitius sinensis]